MIKKTALVFVMVLTVLSGCGEPVVDINPDVSFPVEPEEAVVNTEEEVTEDAPVTVRADSGIEVGDCSLGEDNGFKTP